jgi:hypothetical protein
MPTPKYKVRPDTGELQEYLFEYNGILALKNFVARVDGERLILHSAEDMNFSILDALVSEVEINGVVYDNADAAQQALQRLTFNTNRPVIMTQRERELLLGALQSSNYVGTAADLKSLIDGKVDKEAGKGLSTNDFTNAYKQKLDTLEDYDIELDENTTELRFKKGSNVVRRISLMFLDDEGTKFVYNKPEKTLELRDKRNNLLTSIPVSHFVSNIPDGIVVQNGKIKLMAGNNVIFENAFSYNDLADKPDLNFIPTSWNNRGGKEVLKPQIDDWLRINENGSHPNGTYFGAYHIRTDKGIQVGEGGNKFYVSDEGEVNIKNKTKIVVRDNGNFAVGNMEFNDLVYGEFKGIKLFGNDDNNKVVLAGGGVKDINEIAPSYKTITDAHKFLDKDGAIHFGSGNSIVNAPSAHFYEMVGFTHSSKNWGFIIAKNLDVNDRKIYVKQVITGSYTGWFELNGNSENISIRNDIECNHNHNDSVIFVENPLTIQLKDLISLDCVSFRKVFAGGQVTFTCTGKTIIYTGDNAFNGGDGSTAVVSIWNNKCYIDIRNV